MTALPGMPVPPPRSPKKPVKPGVQAVRVRAGRLCEQCCREGAPSPRVARWRVSVGEVAERLCEGHKARRCDGE